MHKFSSDQAIRRVRLAALLFGAKCLLTPLAAGVLLYSLGVADQQLTFFGLGMLGAALFAVIMQWLVARRASCPLCLAPVLARNGCAKHRTARPLLGSHRLRVALAVLLTNRFRCPYCGEPTLMQVRESRRH
jgi:hypothetical protein